MKRRIITVFTVISSLIAALSLSFQYLLPLLLPLNSGKAPKRSEAIGIIGGADGPTAIFIGDSKTFDYFSLIFALLAIAGIIYLFATGRRTSKPGR